MQNDNYKWLNTTQSPSTWFDISEWKMTSIPYTAALDV